ncbi:uncharacterized protein MEPE_03152 [Melanopsichium pennsylvanicum]|uniref:Uncharacterized protein n=1 Tax=Melanopsichium pennsylvanicum TaxID=63383 RepID=A0AAJ4XNU3_9BASI|nr:uncharacterized protein MEPE_03152 [Melanopsichium pennsylvanicum]
MRHQSRQHHIGRKGRHSWQSTPKNREAGHWLRLSSALSSCQLAWQPENWNQMQSRENNNENGPSATSREHHADPNKFNGKTEAGGQGALVMFNEEQRNDWHKKPRVGAY